MNTFKIFYVPIATTNRSLPRCSHKVWVLQPFIFQVATFILFLNLFTPKCLECLDIPPHLLRTVIWRSAGWGSKWNDVLNFRIKLKKKKRETLLCIIVQVKMINQIYEKSAVFWVLTPFNSEMFQYFGEIYRPHLLDARVRQETSRIRRNCVVWT
jgi:hypothetical protein